LLISLVLTGPRNIPSDEKKFFVIILPEFWFLSVAALIEDFSSFWILGELANSF
jgi:hypothetical protein